MDSNNSGGGRSFIETIIITMLGVSTANADVTNEGIANETAKVLIPWYGHLLNILAGYDLYEQMRGAGCAMSTIIKELIFYAFFFAILPALIAFTLFSFVIGAVILILWGLLVVPFLQEASANYAVESCRKE